MGKMAPIYEQLNQLPPSNALKDLLMTPLRNLSFNLTQYAELIENTVDFEALNRHEYIIRADFDPSLSGIHLQKEAIMDQIEREFNRVVRLLGLEKGKKIKLERNSTYGYFFRISRLDGGVLSGKDDFQELAALKNGIYFVSSTLRDLSFQYDELGRQYSTAQHALVLEMIKVAKSYRRLFDEINQVIARVDVFQSLAYAAVMSPIPLVRPAILASGSEMVLEKARHPCVEAATNFFIPNNVHFTTNSSLQLITGPNMGGKSTFIRQTAMIVLMAQIGSFVPCEKAQIPIFDSVLVRVGAGDSILRGISTFMMEMLETSSILKTATPHSLVIIDELGRGTSTSEGLGLAWAVSKVLADRGCFTFFATHFHELTELANINPRIINLHTGAELTESGLVMTFKVKAGYCDQSYGVQVAEMAKFPPKVVDMARIMLKDLEGNAFTEEEAELGLDYISRKKTESKCAISGECTLSGEGALQYQALINAPLFVKNALGSLIHN